MRLSVFAAVLFLALPSMRAFSQQAERPDVGASQAIHLNIVVTPGKDGKPVGDLPQASFHRPG